MHEYARINAVNADYRIGPPVKVSQAQRIAHLEHRIAESAAVWGESKGVRELRAQLTAIRAEGKE